MIPDYVERVKKMIARLYWLIDKEYLETEHDEDADMAIIGGNITFKDGSVLHFKEVLTPETRHYRYHYTDKESILICRWDSAPHHKNIKTFPYHLHTAEGVKECKSVDLIDIMRSIEDMVVNQLDR